MLRAMGVRGHLYNLLPNIEFWLLGKLAGWIWASIGGGVALLSIGTALYLWLVIHWQFILGYFIIGFLALIGVLLIYLIIDLRRYRSLVVEITSPSEGDEVGYEQIIKGYITLPDMPLQAWVFSGDNLWHLQAPVQVDGHNWSVPCNFGLKDNPRPDNNLTGEHNITITLGKKFKESTRATLSDVPLKSKPVRVIRKATASALSP